MPLSAIIKGLRLRLGLAKIRIAPHTTIHKSGRLLGLPPVVK